MKTLKKTLCLVLAVVMVVGVLILPAYAKDNYDSAIDKLQDYGVLQGYPDGLVHEDRSITRGQMAAIIYRAMTGDTGSLDAQVAVKFGSYADKFTDADVAPWAKGYIGFCASQGVLKGYDTGAVQPNKKISGYEVMAMLLRALGYDHNGEYTGLDWKYNVLSDAAKTGVNAGVTEISPDAETPRGAVAQYAFNAATKTQMVAATINPVGYKSLGKALIEEGTATVEYDDFGAPETKTPIQFNWSINPVKKTLTDGGKPIKQWWTPVVECDVATAAGIDKNTLYTTYTNGKDNKGTVTINPTDERSTIGDYGRETSLYKGGIIVFKDIVLAKIDKVTPKITDNAGHTIKKAGYSVTVYYGDGYNGYTKAATFDDDDVEFEKGDMIRAYSLTNTDYIGNASSITLYDAVKVTETQVSVDAIIEDRSNDPSGFKGADGTTYMYSSTYGYNGGENGNWLVKLDDTDIGSTWGVYTDGHNNVIGLKAADTVKGYGVITNVDAERVAFGKYAAKLSVLTADNKTVTIQILNPLNGEYFRSEDEIVNVLDGYLGQLVQYGEDTGADVTGYNEIIGWGNIRIQDFGWMICAGTATDLEYSPRMNDNTVFFIERYTVSASKGGYISNGYEVIKGFKNIGDLSHNPNDRVDGEQVDLTVSTIDTNRDGWAEYVLITGATIVEEDEKEEVDNYALLVDPTHMVETHDTYRLYKAVINGVETTLSLTFNASQYVRYSTGLYTYAERTTNNGAYGDVRFTDQYIASNVNLAKAYKAGALNVGNVYNGNEYYLAVADDVKVFFVNPDTGKTVESKYNLETVLTTTGFNIESVWYQTNEYGFIDLVYIVSASDDTALPDTTEATIGVTSYESGANAGWIVVGTTKTATNAEKLAAVYDYLTDKFDGYTVTITQENGGTPTAKATLTSNGITTTYEWKINLNGNVITWGKNETAIGAVGPTNDVLISDILLDAADVTGVTKTTVGTKSYVVRELKNGWIYTFKTLGSAVFTHGYSFNIQETTENIPAKLPFYANGSVVALDNVSTPIDVNGNNVILSGNVTGSVIGADLVAGTATIGVNGSLDASEIAAKSYITVKGDVNVTYVDAGATVTVEKGGTLDVFEIEPGANVEAKDLSNLFVVNQSESVKYVGEDVIKTLDAVSGGVLFNMDGALISIPNGAASSAGRNEFLVKLYFGVGGYHAELVSRDNAGNVKDVYYEDFNVDESGQAIYMFCPAALNDGATAETSHSNFYKVVPNSDKGIFVEQGTGLTAGTWDLIIYNRYGEMFVATFTVTDD